ncbi:MAG TPA: NAD-dependent succinate-semialdehyde dehydrogenase [Gemmatimonadaceae bacterium]|nr:NAD-dependent succinate-semialdehyde dehydrogenase [Gemmatimonadaceae bacterium]
MTLNSINPATGETLATFESHSAADVDARLRRAHDAFPAWSHTPIAERARVVARAAELLDARQDEYARLMTLEMGKLLAAAREESAKCAAACRYYAEHAAAMLADERMTDGAEHGYVAFHPLGAVLAIMPWNFPFWQVIRFAAPALVAGNVGLLKHASNVPQCAMALERLFRDAGAPDGVFQTLLIGSDVVGPVIEDPRIVAVSLTGSEGAGAQVASRAGKHLKKQVLELGGSDAFVVMPSANVDQAVETAVRARTINNGQSCIAAKRFIVHERIVDDFTRRFTDAMTSLRVGDPMDAATQVGPLAMPQLVDDLERQVRDSVAKGSRVLTGGARREGRGCFFLPTVLVDVAQDGAAYRDELFGPVAPVFRARDAADAVRIANDTRFGLGAAAWTNDAREARYFARELHAGTVFVNGMVASDARFPFGGVKASGYGRELGSFGLREWVNIKTVRMFGIDGARSHSGTSLSE